MKTKEYKKNSKTKNKLPGPRLTDTTRPPERGPTNRMERKL